MIYIRHHRHQELVVSGGVHCQGFVFFLCEATNAIIHQDFVFFFTFFLLFFIFRYFDFYTGMLSPRESPRETMSGGTAFGKK